ncbi:hypothetical protein FG05_35357 [Fusarium graminearum]|nr:hypothetical protein FG05_35357 [Fusarium graminearum]
MWYRIGSDKCVVYLVISSTKKPAH